MCRISKETIISWVSHSIWYWWEVIHGELIRCYSLGFFIHWLVTLHRHLHVARTQKLKILYCQYYPFSYFLSPKHSPKNKKKHVNSFISLKIPQILCHLSRRSILIHAWLSFRILSSKIWSSLSHTVICNSKTKSKTPATKFHLYEVLYPWMGYDISVWSPHWSLWCSLWVFSRVLIL